MNADRLALQTGAVTDTKIADGVDGAKISDGTVTPAWIRPRGRAPGRRSWPWRR